MRGDGIADREEGTYCKGNDYTAQNRNRKHNRYVEHSAEEHQRHTQCKHKYYVLICKFKTFFLNKSVIENKCERNGRKRRRHNERHIQACCGEIFVYATKEKLKSRVQHCVCAEPENKVLILKGVNQRFNKADALFGHISLGMLDAVEGRFLFYHKERNKHCCGKRKENKCNNSDIDAHAYKRRHQCKAEREINDVADRFCVGKENSFALRFNNFGKGCIISEHC